MRILFIGEGRLGNQIFQYAALSALAAPGARILAFGLEDLSSIFEMRGPRVTCVRTGLWGKRAAKYLLAGLLLRPLARWLRLISYAHEPEVGEAYRGKGGRLEFRPGLISGLIFVDGGYYQSSEHWREWFPPRWLGLRAEIRDRVDDVLASRGVTGSRRCFLHVRRGDYQGFATHGLTDLMLPTSFFREALREVQSRHRFQHVLIVTDDAAWASREFADVPDAVVISGDPRTDFALMAGCQAGILSNSTFSLAAALFMQDPDIVIAPRYWFGFRVGQWLPAGIRFDHPRIAYRDALPSAAA